MKIYSASSSLLTGPDPCQGSDPGMGQTPQPTLPFYQFSGIIIRIVEYNSYAIIKNSREFHGEAD